MKKRILIASSLFAIGAMLVFCTTGSRSTQAKSEFELVSTIAFSSDDGSTPCDPLIPLAGAEIFLASPDGTNTRQLTHNDNCENSDFFASLSNDGKKIVFDRNPDHIAGKQWTTVPDLFLMDTDGTEQTLLVRGGSSATWSPDSKYIAFHASASGTGVPTRANSPGSPTTDSDIFVANVDDLLAGVASPTNITNSPNFIDDDADWSPDGTKIVFTRHPVTDDLQRSNQAEIFVMNPDGTGVTQLTSNTEEERAPSWSPDGSRIVYMCRIGGGSADFEICTMNADGTNQTQLTNNTLNDATPSFSPDGDRIVFHSGTQGTFRLILMNADGTDQTQFIDDRRLDAFANWSLLRVHKSPH